MVRRFPYYMILDTPDSRLERAYKARPDHFLYDSGLWPANDNSFNMANDTELWHKVISFFLCVSLSIQKVFKVVFRR